MPNKPKLATQTVNDLQRDAAAIVKRVGETKQPIRITANGQPPVVVLDEDTYDYYIHLINLSRLIMEGLADASAKRARPLDEFLKEFADAKGIPSGDLRGGSGRRRAHL
jgi:prevent-host-death family protein